MSYGHIQEMCRKVIAESATKEDARAVLNQVLLVGSTLRDKYLENAAVEALASLDGESSESRKGVQ